jgi:hypothetical protein
VFSAVYVNDKLTIDFMEGDEFDVHHYCFSVTDEEFEAILARLREKKIPYRSSPHGPMDLKINTDNGGKNLYWFDADGHNWEILTVSYARPGGFRQSREQSRGLTRPVYSARVETSGRLTDSGVANHDPRIADAYHGRLF